MRFQSLMLVTVVLAPLQAAAAGAGEADSLPLPRWSSTPATGDAQPRLAPGTRIRVTHPRLDRVAGRLVAVLGDTLVFKPDAYGGGYMRAVLDDETTVELSTSHRNRVVPGILIGALAAGTIGAYYASVRARVGALAEMLGGPPSPDPATPILVGLAIGGVLGGLAGSGMKVDTWVPAWTGSTGSLERSRPERGVRFAVSLPLR